MLSPFAGRELMYKLAEAAIFFIFLKNLGKSILGLFCSPARAEHFPGPILKKIAL
jgi:hypothetical protein